MTHQYLTMQENGARAVSLASNASLVFTPPMLTL